VTAIQLGPSDHRVWQDIFTPTQAEIAEQVARGLANDEIAEELGMGLHNVKYHLDNVYARLGVKSGKYPYPRIALARWWWQNVERH